MPVSTSLARTYRPLDKPDRNADNRRRAAQLEELDHETSCLTRASVRTWASATRRRVSSVDPVGSGRALAPSSEDIPQLRRKRKRHLIIEKVAGRTSLSVSALAVNPSSSSLRQRDANPGPPLNLPTSHESVTESHERCRHYRTRKVRCPTE